MRAAIYARYGSKATERKVEALREEVKALRASREKVFQAPPIEWIRHRVAELQDVLEQRTPRSALILRRLLGQVRLEPVEPEIGRAYYRAVTALDALALLASIHRFAVGIEEMAVGGGLAGWIAACGRVFALRW